MKYLLNFRNFIFLMILFSFFDNFGTLSKKNKFDSVLFLGDEGVGKTQIINKFVNDLFVENYNQTFDIITIYKKDKCGKIKLAILDTGGKNFWNGFMSVFCKYHKLIIFVYSVDNEISFRNIQKWVEKYKKDIIGFHKFLLVGNKCDLEEKRVVEREKALKYAIENGMDFMEVSAKTGENIENILNNSIKEFGKNINIRENNKTNQGPALSIQEYVFLKNQNEKYINFKENSFCNKYCFCCPCFKETEKNVED